MGRFADDRGGPDGGPDGAPTAADPADPAAALEQIRAGVHRWIDRIEGRLDDRPRSPTVPHDLDRAARDLEKRREGLRAEADRRDREWADRLEALERDRQLLAEAWERLEREQVAPAAPTPPVRAAPAPVPSPTAAPSGYEQDSPVDRAILRQFEALRRDVRRTAEARNPR